MGGWVGWKFDPLLCCCLGPQPPGAPPRSLLRAPRSPHRSAAPILSSCYCLLLLPACSPSLLPQLGQHLSRSEQRQLLHRRDYVLHYFDDLVCSQGYAATVRE
jgi:hypothetical protein